MADRSSEQDLGNYRLLRMLGRGGFAEVYLGEHRHLGTQAAIKILYEQMATYEDNQQFLQEGRLIAALKHPHILSILDFGIQDGRFYLVMEYAPNGSLRDRIRQVAPQPLPPKEALKILRQIGDALAFVHQQNIVHRDIKPENILFNSRDDALLVDFGIAAIAKAEVSRVIGTPAYMSPEQYRGMVSTKSDQYSLGCVAYELFTGQKPFSAPNMTHLGLLHLQEAPRAPSQIIPSISPSIERAILKSLAKEGQKRFDGISAFIAALEETPPISSISTSDTVSETPSSQTPSSQTPQPPSSTIFLPTSRESSDDLKDFFIAYHNADRFWAEWIAWQLEKANYTVILPAWDFHVLTDFQLETQKALAAARYIITVLSPDYLALRKNQEARTIVFQTYTATEQKRTIPIQVRECGSKLQKFLGSRVYIDIVGCDEQSACTLLLDHIRAAIERKPMRPTSPPSFPGKGKALQSEVPPFPLSQDSNGPTFAQREILLIEAALRRKNWSDVIIRTSALIGQDTTTLLPEIYHMQGQALFEVGENERACRALEMALTLTDSKSQRLLLLRDYAKVLATLGRWHEILAHTNEALQLAPNDLSWLEYQQQANTQISVLSRSNPILRPSSYVSQGIEVFLSYSHKDEDLKSELEKYLSNLKRQRSILAWHDGEIGVGKEWDREIEEHINKAHIILLLVSQDFIASDYCYEKEMKRALERHEAGEAHVIPIILRPAHWEVTPFGKLQVLPTGAKPITIWQNRDEAFLDAVRGLQRVVDCLIQGKQI